MQAMTEYRDLARIRKNLAMYHGARTPDAEYHWARAIIAWLPALLAEVEQARAVARQDDDLRCPYCGAMTIGVCDCPAPPPCAPRG